MEGGKDSHHETEGMVVAGSADAELQGLANLKAGAYQVAPVRACPCLAHLAAANHRAVPHSFSNFNCITLLFSRAIRPRARHASRYRHGSSLNRVRPWPSSHRRPIFGANSTSLDGPLRAPCTLRPSVQIAKSAFSAPTTNGSCSCRQALLRCSPSASGTSMTMPSYV